MGLLVTAAPLCSEQPADLYSEQPADAVTIFDGQSLSGWRGDLDHWRVEDGAIVGEIPPGERLDKNTWLVWEEGKLDDFDLRMQFKLSGAAGANSGIQFRCQVESVDHVSGYQADLDKGATWLGRIYDEHGRALLVERGSRVRIAPDGTRTTHQFAPADKYAVLFREDAWNDYRIVAEGEHVAVYINGTLFSELKDEQRGERDLSGRLAFQLHSGPETRVEFRDIRLRHLDAEDSVLPDFSLQRGDAGDEAETGVRPEGPDGAALNLGFEQGTLAGWTATGDAFQDQPVKKDGIASRWPGQTSGKWGDYFVGGFEIVGDGGLGTLTSDPFRVTHPYASMLVGGGNTADTRVEILHASPGEEDRVVFTASGPRREQMRRVVADLRELRGETIAVRLVDENAGPWGHLNFDDFRFHDERPVTMESRAAWRSIDNPILHHLVPNAVDADGAGRAADTVARMFVPRGFSVDVVAAEPELHQPMAFAFDARGRLWVVEGHSYPQKRPEGEGLDRILVFADNDGDGTFETRTVFSEGLNLVSGMEVGYGGVWVGAAPELLFIPDRDGDLQPDGPPQVLLDGFGFADTHETINSFLWGPDGWLYGNQGVFNQSFVGRPDAAKEQRERLRAGVWRYHPVRHEFEVFAHGGSNQWGLDYDEFGQIFMTHCRSRWGGGATTHVIQGGHYWNQVNGGHAPFISSKPLPGRPWMRNYLLASARYGHGEGGAGKRGSRDVYGGHAHVGTMIYLGDNWPREYRNHLLTHNLHGHQMNHQINVRAAGGYDTRHAGHDLLFCGDRQYVGVDLQYGPDGAVYISDWYDPRHCHNPNVEQWDRGNGRLYRMKYDETYQPVKVDYTAATDTALVEAQLHENDWHARTARRVLARRAAEGACSERAIGRLRSMATGHADPTRRLRGLWTLHVTDGLDPELAEALILDENEFVRGWTVQLAIESLPSENVEPMVASLVDGESSLLVRRYLAAAIPKVSSELGWQLAETLCGQGGNAADRELPLLIWTGLARLMADDLERGLKLADATELPAIRDYVQWYATKLSPEGRDAIAGRLAAAGREEQTRLLGLFAHGLRGMRNVAQPEGWASVAAELYDSDDASIRRAAESLGAAFGDARLFARMRLVLSDAESDLDAKRHALSILENDSSPENLPHLLGLLDSDALAPRVIPQLGRFEQPAVARALIRRVAGWDDEPSTAAMEVLTSRAAWAERLLDAIAAGRLEANMLTAYHARQIANLGDASLTQRLTQQWGSVGPASEELRAKINAMVQAYREAPLWAYSQREGGEHFKRLCAACHEPNQTSERLAPRLAGTGSKGIEYIAENVIDPNAVIGQDYQARLLATVDGRIFSGLVEEESDSAITIRTATDRVTVAKADLAEVRVSDNSFMPTGLLEPLNERQRIELLKYLMSL